MQRYFIKIKSAQQFNSIAKQLQDAGFNVARYRYKKGSSIVLNYKGKAGNASREISSNYLRVKGYTEVNEAALDGVCFIKTSCSEADRLLPGCMMPPVEALPALKDFS